MVAHIFKKFKSYILKKYLAYLSAKEVNLESNEFCKYMEPGVKALTRFEPLNVVVYLIDCVTDKYNNKPVISGIYIREGQEEITVNVWTPYPGLLIGKGCEIHEMIEELLTKMFRKKTVLELNESEQLYGLNSIKMY